MPIFDYMGREINIDKAQGIPNFEPSFFYGTFRMSEGQMAGYDEKRPYASHSWIYNCAHKKATELKRLPLKLAKRTETDSDKEQHIYKHEILDSIKKPNSWMTRTTFWEAIVLALELPTVRSTGGQVFLIPETLSGKKVNLRKGEIPDCWYPYDDNWVSANIDNGKFKNWKWEIPGRTPATANEAIFYEPDELIRIYHFNPYDPLHGLAPYVPVKWAVLQDAEASQFNYHFFKNNATLSGILSGDMTLTPAQRQEIAKLFSELYSGSHKAGSVAVLGNGLKYQELSRSHLDMQFSEMKGINKNEVISAYGLNEIAFGELKGIPYSNLVEGLKMLWSETYIPLQEQICEAINQQWVQYVDPSLSLEADYTEVQALKADLGEKVKIAAQMISQCSVPAAEAFRIVGVDVNADDYPWMKEKPVVQNPINPPAEKPEGDETPAKPSGKTIEKSMDEKHKARNESIWKAHIKTKIEAGEKAFYSMFAKYFAGQRNQCLKNVDKWIAPFKAKGIPSCLDEIIVKASINIPKVEDLLFDIEKENEKLMELYRPNLVKQMKREEGSLESELPDGLMEWSVNPDNIESLVDARSSYVKDINTVTFKLASDDISAEVSAAIEEGLTTSQLAQNIKDVLKERYDYRITNANTIARTETNSISSWTRNDAFKTEGIEYQEWITARDDAVRESHMIDGEIRKTGEPFSNGLEYPLDPSGEPEDVINCRCIVVAAKKPEGKE